MNENILIQKYFLALVTMNDWLLSTDNGDVTCDYVTETIKIFNIVYRCL